MIKIPNALKNYLEEPKFYNLMTDPASCLGKMQDITVSADFGSNPENGAELKGRMSLTLPVKRTR